MQTTLHKDPATRNAHSSSEERQFIIICDECDEAIKTKKVFILISIYLQL